MEAIEDEREEELTSIAAIFPELTLDPSNRFAATLELAVAPASPLAVRFDQDVDDKNQAINYLLLSNLPPLKLQVTLPDTYPETSPPHVSLRSEKDWVPDAVQRNLEKAARNLWEEYGHCQILFAYIDHLQQAAERAFDLGGSQCDSFHLDSSFEGPLTTFDAETQRANFNAGTFDCGVCLEPKKGTSCYRMERCGDVFCRQCLRDFYNNAITEGDVATVQCLAPDCGKNPPSTAFGPISSKDKTLHPKELLSMGLEDSMARRYVEMKRKKKIEADPNTVFCPRKWCQHPARNPKYPPLPDDLTTYIVPPEPTADDSTPTQAQLQATPNAPIDPSDRLAICENPSCALAFCRVCFAGWHGPVVRCFPRNPNELSAEEKATYEYIRAHTSPCPTCYSPAQKTMGCNHMKCFQCNTHFCYLCGAWLNGGNPYQHYNTKGTECYQRLWEMEEGDEGEAPAGGFAGQRGWAQVAAQVGRDADALEAEVAAREALRADNRRAAEQAAAEEEEEEDELDEEGERQLERYFEMEEENRRRQIEAMRGGVLNRFQPRQQGRPRNPHPPAGGAADAVRAHERGGRGRGRGRGQEPQHRGGNVGVNVGGNGRNRARPQLNIAGAHARHVENHMGFMEALDRQGEAREARFDEALEAAAARPQFEANFRGQELAGALARDAGQAERTQDDEEVEALQRAIAEQLAPRR